MHALQYLLLCSLYFSEISGHSYVLRRARREADVVLRRLESLAIRVEYLELGLRKEQEKGATLQSLVSQLKSEVNDATGRSGGSEIPQETIEDISSKARKVLKADLDVLMSGLIEEKRITRELSSTVELCKDELVGNTYSLDYLEKSVNDLKETVDGLNKTVEERQCSKCQGNQNNQDGSGGKNGLACKPLQSPDNGWMNINDGPPLVATFGCRSGFSVHGSTRRVCLRDGSWNGTEVKCEIECPKCFANANVRTGPTVFDLILTACREKITYVHKVTVKTITRGSDAKTVMADVQISTLQSGGRYIHRLKPAILWMSKACSCPDLEKDASYMLMSTQTPQPSKEHGGKLEIFLDEQTHYTQYFSRDIRGLTSQQRRKAAHLEEFLRRFRKDSWSQSC